MMTHEKQTAEHAGRGTLSPPSEYDIPGVDEVVEMPDGQRMVKRAPDWFRFGNIGRTVSQRITDEERAAARAHIQRAKAELDAEGVVPEADVDRSKKPKAKATKDAAAPKPKAKAKKG